jgi:hypothetical protein
MKDKKLKICQKCGYPINHTKGLGCFEWCGCKKTKEAKVKPACENCKHNDRCSHNVLFALGGWNSEAKEITSCSQFESKSV